MRIFSKKKTMHLICNGVPYSEYVIVKNLCNRFFTHRDNFSIVMHDISEDKVIYYFFCRMNNKEFLTLCDLYYNYESEV